MKNLEVFSIGSMSSDTHVILCHGFGATGRDLVDLTKYFDPELSWCWHFPQGPVPVPGYFGFAWFPRTPVELSQALAGHYFSNLEAISDPGLAQSAHEIAEWIRESGLENKRIVVGGFSQGAMVALQLAIQEQFSFAGLVLLSGTLIAKQATLGLLKSSPKIPIFQSHGTFDTVLDYRSASELREILTQNGFSVEWHSFSGGHEIPIPVLDSAKKFLSNLN